MPNALVECIPNFSEARRPEVVEAILAAIGSVEGVNILDQHSDMDHNRTVVTYVGAPSAVEEAAFQAITKAAELINLDNHQGEHPDWRNRCSPVCPYFRCEHGGMCGDGPAVGEASGRILKKSRSNLYEEAATRPEKG